MSRLKKYGKVLVGGLLGASVAKSLGNRYSKYRAGPQVSIGGYDPAVSDFLGYVPDSAVVFGQGKYRYRKNGGRRYRRRAPVRKSRRSSFGIKELSKRLAFAAALAGAAGFGAYYGKVGARRLNNHYNRVAPPPAYGEFIN